jgi:hypothetical protein
VQANNSSQLVKDYLRRIPYQEKSKHETSKITLEFYSKCVEKIDNYYELHLIPENTPSELGFCKVSINDDLNDTLRFMRRAPDLRLCKIAPLRLMI